MTEELLQRAASRVQQHLRTLSTGSMLLYNDEEDMQLVRDVVGSISGTDQYIIKGSSFNKDSFVSRIKEVVIPIGIKNGRIVEDLAINYKLEGGQLVKRTSAELAEYLQKSSRNKIIKDLYAIADVVTKNTQYIQYYKEHAKEEKNEKKVLHIDLSHDETAQNINMGNVISYIDTLVDKLDERTLSVLSNKPVEQNRASLKRFIKNYVVEFFDKGKVKQDAFKKKNEIIGSQMYMVLGAAGAGKSSTIKHLEQSRGALHLVSDDVKASLAVSFGIDVNMPEIHALGGSILKAVLMPCSLENKIDVILEKVGDESHKIKSLAKMYRENGYNINLSCIHVDIDECRVRNICRSIGFMQKGQPARMVPDEVVRQMGINPLMTYMMLTGEDEFKAEDDRLFSGGECFVNQLGRSQPAHKLESLSCGSFRNRRQLQNYEQTSLMQRERLAKALVNKFILLFPNMSAKDKTALQLYAQNLANGKDAIAESNANMKYLYMFKALYDRACAEMFRPNGDMIITANKDPDHASFRGNFSRYITAIVTKFCDQNNFRYQQALDAAKAMFESKTSVAWGN